MASGSAPAGSAGSSLGRVDQRPVRRRRLVDRGVEIVAQRRAERRLIAARDADRVDRARPRAVRIRAQKPGDRARLRLQPLRGAFGLRQRAAMARLDLPRLGVALLRRKRLALGAGQRLGQFGDRARAPFALLVLEARRAERAALALDSRVFRLEPGEAAPFLLDGCHKRPLARGAIGGRGLRFGQRGLGAREAARGAFLRFARLRRVVRLGFLLGQRAVLGGEPVHDARRIRDQRFLALKVAGELRDAAVKLGLALFGALLFRCEGVAGERDAMERRAASRLLLAQARQGGGGDRLRPRGLALRAGALGHLDEAGVEALARVGERRLVFPPGDELRQRFVTADRAGQFAVAVRLARLTLEAVDLGVDLLARRPRGG